MIDLADTRRRLFAAFYQRVDPGLRQATGAWRERLVGDLTGDVLEIGAGTGANFGHYSPEARVVATDNSEHMLRRARAEASRARGEIEVRAADAMALPFEAGRFDAVVSTLVLCSVPDLGGALAGVRRVLRPGGALRLLEHVRSDRRPVAAMQHMVSPAWAFFGDGCRLDRDTLTAVRAAGFDIESAEEPRFRMPGRHIVVFARKRLG